MTDSTDRLYERVLVLRCQTGDETAFANSSNAISHASATTSAKCSAPHTKARPPTPPSKTPSRTSGSTSSAPSPAWPTPASSGPGSTASPGTAPSAPSATAPRPTSPLTKTALPSTPRRRSLRFTQEDAQQIHAALDDLPAEHREVWSSPLHRRDDLRRNRGVGKFRRTALFSRLALRPRLLARRLESEERPWTDKDATDRNATDKELGRALLNVDRTSSPGRSRPAADEPRAVLDRDRRQIRWLAGAAILFWTLTAAGLDRLVSLLRDDGAAAAAGLSTRGGRTLLMTGTISAGGSGRLLAAGGVRTRYCWRCSRRCCWCCSRGGDAAPDQCESGGDLGAASEAVKCCWMPQKA